MNDKDAKKLERLTERYKKNNEKIKQNYDRVSIALPKGTKDRIKATGDTLNNFIINAVMERLKAAEADLQQATQEATKGTTPGARTNRHEATKSATEGRTEAQEPKPRSRSTQETTCRICYYIRMVCTTIYRRRNYHSIDNRIIVICIILL